MIMNKLVLSVRFHSYNVIQEQYEYLVQCIRYTGCENAASNVVVKVATNGDRTEIGKVLSSDSVQNIVAPITDEQGCKNFEQAFLQGMKEGFENSHAAFNININQSELNPSEFIFDEIDFLFVRYTKPVNDNPCSKFFSADVSAAVAYEKLYWLKNNDWKPATQLNVDRFWDEEDDLTLYSIEFDYEGHWRDASTWESGDDVLPYFTLDREEYVDLMKKLAKDIDFNFDSDWETVYTKDGKYMSRLDYEAQKEEQEKDGYDEDDQDDDED